MEVHFSRYRHLCVYFRCTRTVDLFHNTRTFDNDVLMASNMKDYMTIWPLRSLWDIQVFFMFYFFGGFLRSRHQKRGVMRNTRTKIFHAPFFFWLVFFWGRAVEAVWKFLAKLRRGHKKRSLVWKVPFSALGQKTGIFVPGHIYGVRKATFSAPPTRQKKVFFHSPGWKQCFIREMTRERGLGLTDDTFFRTKSMVGPSFFNDLYTLIHA